MLFRSAGLVASHEWRAWMESCVRSGKMRSFGLASSAEAVRPFFKSDAMIGSVIQLRDSVAGREADILDEYAFPRQITYGYVSAALRADPTCRVADVLTAALSMNRTGAIIVTSGRQDRLRQYGRLTESPTDA